MYLFFKPFLDFILAVFIFILTAPLIILICFFLKIFTKGDIFFIHKRIGFNGKIFSLYKFRTMKHNRKYLLENYFRLNKNAKDEWNQTQKLKNDPRITEIGYYLRELSLDELPQIINIIKGDMSFVGPRPIVQKEIEKYGNAYKEYAKCKPGLTGLWQVSGRNDTTYQKRVELDLFYAKHKSLWLDIKIILKTIPVVLSRKGAY